MSVNAERLAASRTRLSVCESMRGVCDELGVQQSTKQLCLTDDGECGRHVIPRRRRVRDDAVVHRRRLARDAPSGRSAVSAARIVAPSSPVSRSAYVSMHDCRRCVTVKLNNLSKPANPTLPTADVRSANVRMPTASVPSALNHALC